MKRNEKGQSALPSLSNAEWDVMQVFWDHGPMATRDVVEALSKSHDWAYRTISTLLSRMVDKGALKTDRVGNSFLYSPAFSRDRLTRKEIKGFVNRVLSGSLTPLVTGFIEEASLTDEDIKRLSKLLEKKKQQHNSLHEEEKL